MHTQLWSDTYLDEARKMGDPLADQLVESVLTSSPHEADTGRLAYNVALDLADRILASPALVFVPDSALNEHLRQVPDSVTGYFAPMAAPEWVDAAKLELGARLWHENMLPMLAVLYAYSLPACYLISRGIPALYQTSKLRDPRYLSQRIYETGLMLDAVMGKNGLKLIEDIGSDARKTRYLWGDGYVTAKKVRFLHASMRYMLTHDSHRPTQNAGGEPATLAAHMSQQDSTWDTQSLGVPINQEDLAYTLLTFGYALPRGLQHWGCPIDKDQREAFLHLWRVVGHVMGLDDNLMTDDWQQAEDLLQTIAKRQAARSDDGVALTEALLGFLASYLPDHLGLSERIAALMIIDQLGPDDAAKILRAELIAAATRLDRRLIYALGRGMVRTYYRIRSLVLRRFPTVASLFGNLLDQSAHELMQSWRGAYVRRPFYVPANSSSWKLKQGADEAFLKRLRSWRRRLFNALGLAIALLFVAAFSLLALLPAWWLGSETSLRGTAILCVASAVGALATMKWRLPAIFSRRPLVSEHPSAMP